MDLTLITLSQDVSFEDGSITNFISLRTPSGQVVRAIVSDDSTKLLFDESASQKHGVPVSSSAQPARQPPPQPSPRQQVEDDGTVVFGGDSPQGEPSEGSFWTPEPPNYGPEVQEVQRAPSPADPQAHARQYQQEQKALRERMRRHPMGTQNGLQVDKDDRGYPIARGSGTDPGEVMGSVAGGDVDDDGVGSI